jgi:hypothetical protein
MNQNDIVQFKKWFSTYVADYYTGDREYDLPIRLKEEHTKKVCDIILTICHGLHLPEQDCILAETIALFHDLGRFEQYTRYGTFNDAISANHARMGVAEMGKHGVLSGLKAAEKRLISKAVAYHNAPFLGDNHPERDRLFMCLIRDADKLDVWRILIDYYKDRHEHPHKVIELDLPDEPTCSPEIINAFSIHSSALLRDAKTINDVILLQISWVYDLNFAESFQMAQHQKVIDRLSGFLPPLPSVKSAVEKARRHVENNLAGCGT